MRVSAVFGVSPGYAPSSGPAYQGFAAYSPSHPKAHALILNEKHRKRLLR
ncbi:MAG: hypothetical protein ACYCS1_10545 [Gammaproteobacteria bacterium]